MLKSSYLNQYEQIYFMKNRTQCHVDRVKIEQTN